MRRWLAMAAVAQVAVLAAMAVDREWLLATGTRVRLRTAPVDPRDVLRGDYVRLGYDIGHLDAVLYGPALRALLEQRHQRPVARWSGHDEMTVYVALRVRDGIAVATGVDLQRPDGLAIRGRTRLSSDGGELTTGLSVTYGIDAWYVEQGRAGALEQRRPEEAPEGITVPLDMEVALSPGGEAALCGFRWGPLGISARWLRPTEPPPTRDGPLPDIEAQLWNSSDEPLALLLPEGQAGWSFADAPPASPPPAGGGTGETLVIPPHHAHRLRLPAAAIDRRPAENHGWWPHRLVLDLGPPPPDRIPAGARAFAGRIETMIW